MATRKSAAPPPIAPKLQLPPAAIQKGIERLGQRIDALREFDPKTVPEGDSPELKALSVSIKETLERCFGENTSAFKRYEPAAKLSWFEMIISYNYTTPPYKYIAGVTKNIANSIALLEQAQSALQDDLDDLGGPNTQVAEISVADAGPSSRKVFVVHGHDGEAREMVARFLKAMDFEPVILHEQPNQGGTVIEKFEANSDVGFAVVLLTPDDVGRSVKEEEWKPRARQNVLLELGYFIGRLGRKHVCALKRGDVELPSDYVGVLWEKMDDGGGWKLSLARELKAAGLEVDLNRAFSL
ncbi:nucleotide-binding protein [Robbsia andropogonis]|uniref:Nucleotide-binding protein n=1 Tax=Robbsia andropogonis TaxID=28092 RepID=A0A0F5JT32_9BURK|nr:nucleotide-binding protein [Robbsia andropogonis]KKB60824.1 nucleotide-binding protein [Robbsia andropogonis]